MKARLIFISLFFILFFSGKYIPAQNSVSGTVFLDQNSNGFPDKTEKGIRGVYVSNGKEVVETDADGKWTLPVCNGTGIFVIKPADYAVPLSRDQIPQHFFLYRKADSPQVNFPLTKSSSPEKFKVLFFGDTQTRGLKEVNYMNHDVVEECIGTDALFGVSLGDITADGPELFEEVNRGIAQIGIPWYNTFGNHDCDRDTEVNEEKDDSFERIYGPSTYAFEYGQVVFITLNNIYFRPGGKYRPHFTDDQLEFVKNYLATVPLEKLIVLMMHAPVVACDNREKLFGLLQGRSHTFSISGHVHEQMHVFAGKESGWKGNTLHHHLINATVCGSWWCGLQDETGIPHATMNDGAPNGYSVITFDGNRYSIRFKAARKPENYQMNIYLPETISVRELGKTNLLVNVFAGSERSVVEMELDRQGNWIPLKQVRTTDPECYRMYQLSTYLKEAVNGIPLEDIFGYMMDKPSKTDHMWEALLPDDILPGTHTVTVRTADMFGQVWQANRIFRVVE
jgi:hypothetical protein